MSELVSRSILQPDKWVDVYADSLFRFTILRVKDQHTAEDLVQESFLSAWKSRHTYNGSSSERNWLFAICKNKIIDHYRSLNTKVIIEDLSHFFDEEEHWTEAAAPASWSEEKSAVDNKDLRNALELCRKKLKSLPHAVFTMKYLDGTDAKQICSILGVTMQNYWVLIHRAKLQLRECLELNWIKK